MNKRQHAAALANLRAQLSAATAIVAQYDELFGSRTDLDDAVTAAWGAAHDMVSRFEAQIRRTELDGYGRSLVSAETSALVVANID